MTYEDGGALSATASDGTTFDLWVPSNAVLDDTLVRMTPLTEVRGFGEGPVHAVQLEPAGLAFFAVPRLTITPASPIPVEDQIMFHASSEGDEVIAALVDVTSERIVLLTPHFSALGVAKARGHAQFLYAQSAGALQRLSSQAGQVLQNERKRQLAGQPARPEVWDEVLELFEQANRDVLGPLKEAAFLDCGAAQKYLEMLRGIEKVASYVGLSAEEYSGAVQNELARALDASFPVCEREAIQKCTSSEPPAPGILLSFWVGWDRQLTLLELEPKIVQGDSEARARRICLGAFALELTATGLPNRTRGGFATVDIDAHVQGCPRAGGGWDFTGTYTFTTHRDGNVTGSDGWLLDMIGQQTPDQLELLFGYVPTPSQQAALPPTASDGSGELIVTDVLESPRARARIENAFDDEIGTFDLSVSEVEPHCDP